MKRILCLLCVLALAAGFLAACGKNNPPPPPPGFTSAEQGGGVVPPAGNNDPQPGGSANPVIPSNPGAEMSEFAEALSQLNSAFSATWPENVFTKQVPKPKFEVGLGTVTETEYSFLCGADIPALREYVKDLQRAGFNKNADTQDTSAFGFSVYSYTADNNKGFRVEINNAMGISTIKIMKLGNLS